MMTVEQIESEIDTLPPSQRVRLADHIVSHLPFETDADTWASIDRRVAELLSGEVETVSEADAISSVKAALKGLRK